VVGPATVVLVELDGVVVLTAVVEEDELLTVVLGKPAVEEVVLDTTVVLGKLNDVVVLAA